MMVRDYAGPNWGEEVSGDKKKPVNLLSLYVQIVGRSLVGKAPRALYSTFQKRIKPIMAVMQEWANKEIEAIKLGETLQRILLDAFFFVGIAKTSIVTPLEAASSAWGVPAGVVATSVVDLDDFAFDPHAKDFRECSFLGHRYRVPLSVAKEWKEFSKARKDLSASTHAPQNREGDDRVTALGREPYPTSEEFEDMVDLWEIYLPRHRQVITLSDDQLDGASLMGGKALREQDWVGPDDGPYSFLGFGTVPGNAMPKAPMHDVFDLHDATNRSFRKVIRMVDRLKEISTFRGQSDEDAVRLNAVSDGDWARVDDPQGINQIIMGGKAMQPVFGIATMLKDLFNVMAGNLELMGGRAASTSTVGQDKMLNQNAEAGIAEMQERTLLFVSDIIRRLSWFWWHDPFKTMRSTYTVPGLPGISIDRRVAPMQRQLSAWKDLDIKIDPYSMAHKTPQMRLQFINAVVNQLVPMMPILAQQGIAFDANAWIKMIAELGDEPRLAEIFTYREPAEQESTSGAEAPGMQAETTRSYIRENRSEATQQGTNRNMVGMMLGKDQGGNPEGNGQMNGQL